MLKETRNWNINITSFANVKLLDDEQVIEMFNCFNNKHYQKWLIKFAKDDIKFKDCPDAIWQLEKSRDIEKLFHNSIVYKRNFGIINCYVNLNIMFPESFNRFDVAGWVEGFGRLSKVHLLNQTSEFIRSKKVIEKIENNFLHELFSNQKYLINGITI